VITPIGWQFGFTLVPAFALVLWALGWSMIVMAGLVHLPRGLVTALAIALIAGHNLFDRVQPGALGTLGPLWQMLHVPGFVIPGKLFVGYPLIPWIGVMAIGYVAARAYAWDPDRRRRILLFTGVGAVALFLLLRAVNGYGNPLPWSEQRTPGLTIASFLNVRKYPPSLHFLLMTLGTALVALALLERVRNRVTEWLSVIGRVPLFFYVGHIFAAHALAMVLIYLQGGTVQRVPIIHDPAAIPEWYGVSLPGVYTAWAIVVIAMYFPCRWFARLKDTRTDWWLRYL
jgi:uncharacterized membrane protein